MPSTWRASAPTVRPTLSPQSPHGMRRPPPQTRSPCFPSCAKWRALRDTHALGAATKEQGNHRVGRCNVPVMGKSGGVVGIDCARLGSHSLIAHPKQLVDAESTTGTKKGNQTKLILRAPISPPHSSLLPSSPPLPPPPFNTQTAYRIGTFLPLTLMMSSSRTANATSDRCTSSSVSWVIIIATPYACQVGAGNQGS